MQSVADNAFFENVELSFCMLCLIVFHISASVLIFYGVQTGEVKRFFLPAMGLHMTLEATSHKARLTAWWRTYEKIPPTYGASASSY